MQEDSPEPSIAGIGGGQALNGHVPELQLPFAVDGQESHSGVPAPAEDLPTAKDEIDLET